MPRPENTRACHGPCQRHAAAGVHFTANSVYLCRMDIRTQALVLAVLPHGEHGAVVRLFSGEHGLIAGYVRGGRSRALRPVLQPGNRVIAALHARTQNQLAAATIELDQSRAGLGLDALSALILGWLTSLTAEVLGEGAVSAQLYTALDSILTALGLGADPRDASAAVARYELLLLGELGFGLDLSRCAATGSTQDLRYVSPRSSQAVSAAAGLPYASRLLPLPALLRGASGSVDWPDVVAAFATTGHFLRRDVLVGRHARLLEARDRLESQIARQQA